MAPSKSKPEYLELMNVDDVGDEGRGLLLEDDEHSDQINLGLENDDIFNYVGRESVPKHKAKNLSQYTYGGGGRSWSRVLLLSLLVLVCGIVGAIAAYYLYFSPDPASTYGALSCDVGVIDWDNTNPSPLEVEQFGNRSRDCMLAHSEAVLTVQGSPAYILSERLQHYNRIITIQYNMGLVGLLASVHPDPKVVNAATNVDLMIDQTSSILDLDERQFYAVAELTEPEFLPDDPLALRFLGMLYNNFESAGIGESDDDQDEIEQLNTELSILTTAFGQNIANSRQVYSVEADSDLLSGLDADFISSHTNQSTGMVDISTDYPDYMPVMRSASNAELRQAVYEMFNNRAYPDNAVILKEVLQKRYELAQLQNFSSYADMSLASKMVKNASTVHAYLQRISDVVSATAQSQMQTVAELTGLDVTIPYNYGFGITQYRAATFNVNNTEIEQYFSTVGTLSGVLAIARRFFGVELVQNANTESLNTWHPDVDVFDIINTTTGVMLGRAFLDLYPRDGKFSHAAVFPMRRGVSGIQLPVAALVCNFARAPARLAHSEVTTFFHEFGHLMHHVLAGQNQPWVVFSGMAMAFDFVEAPSQMLEKWPVAKDVLDLFAFSDVGNVIPQSLVDTMVSGSKFGTAVDTMQQIYYAYLSLKLHQIPDPGSKDLDEIVEEIAGDYSPFQYMSDTHMYASFGHLMGYGAGYYTYQWSLGIAQDMFYSEFCPDKMLDIPTAQKYQTDVLAPGGKVSATQLVENFIGRPWNEKHYTDFLRGELKTVCDQHHTTGIC